MEGETPPGADPDQKPRSSPQPPSSQAQGAQLLQAQISFVNIPLCFAFRSLRIFRVTFLVKFLLFFSFGKKLLVPPPLLYSFVKTNPIHDFSKLVFTALYCNRPVNEWSWV